jgi:hypothetical protein
MTTATPLVQRCRFEGNEGSAVLVGEGTVVYLIDCTFEDNTARSDDGIGGGAVQNRGFVLIFTSLLRGNAVEAVAGPARGGAVAHVGLALDLTTNTFEANRVSGPQATEGAAVYAAGDFVLNAGTFRDHTGDHAGAVVMIDGSTLAAPIAPFVDGLFEMNTVGGLRLVDPLDLVEARLSSSTFCRNTPFDVIGSFVDFGANRVCCPGDIDGNGDTGFGDLSSLLTAWGPCDGCAADLDLSGAVGFPDLAALLAAWGDCPQLDFGG